MEKYIIVYREGFYLGSWIIGVLEIIISWEYATAPPEIGPNLRHCSLVTFLCMAFHYKCDIIWLFLRLG